MNIVPTLARVFFAPAIFLLALALRAQSTGTGTIEGRIGNARSGEFLERARVTIEGSTLEAFTDSSGQYRISYVPAGPVEFKVFYANSKQQVVDWMKRCPVQEGDVIEIRQVYETSDFPADVQAAARGA